MMRPVAKVIKLDDNKSVELMEYGGGPSYRWAFCRNSEVVRWLDRDTLELDLVRKLAGNMPQDMYY